MKSTFFISAFMATLLSSGVLAAPAPVQTGGVDLGRSGYNGVEVTARDDEAQSGRSGYNSVEVKARNDGTDGRSGYNSIEVTARDDGTDGRSGYNSVEARADGTSVETDGRSGYN
ncbi:hypothetical protein VP1G_05313 [Cytospora mali]|uniref:Uncharacterized protein n=1 Tax=Cytospora mali TaxID=578113 RepID=A0A194V257_CYTMA|nr:hypothetical protein VP1G_05313 [Valsa mali var. pyri (nom. inval.)]